MMLWGGISWSISPIVQNYLIHTGPTLADASVGLNVSAMHAGVALGSALGGVLVGRDALLVTPWAGCVLVAVALACAWVAARPARQAVRTS
jgi:DHA1 family purine base/nucleoside efflux pump-like MFS transporter